MFTVDSALCRGCGQCVQACTRGALSIQQRKAVINVAKCAQCGDCAAQCPFHAIANRSSPEAASVRWKKPPVERDCVYQLRQRFQRWRSRFT